MTTEHAFAVPTDPSAWCGRLQREHPDLSVEVTGIRALPDGSMIETIRIVGRDAVRGIETVRFTESVEEFEIVHEEPDACTLRIRMRSCAACLAAHDARLMPTLPLVLGQGGCQWRLAAPPEGAREFAARLAQTPQAPTLRRKRTIVKPALLTLRQREILEEAVRRGYYARPRRVSLTQLAGHLGIRKSSLSQSLALIEAKLMPRWVEHLARDE